MKKTIFSSSEVMTDSQAFYVVLCLSLFQLLIWTAVPCLLLKGTYIDILENLAWAAHPQWGYDKDPYLGPLITWLGYNISGGQLGSAYFLSQLSIVMAYFSVFHLARKMLPMTHALIAVTVLAGVAYYSSSSPEFNDDMLELSLWALTSVFFYEAVLKQKIMLWAAVGFFAGCALMAKYLSLFLLLSLWIFLCRTVQGRASFSKPGLYIALLVFLILVMPNALWLYHHSFIAIHYAFARANLAMEPFQVNWVDHIKYPILFCLHLFGTLLPMLFLIFLCFKISKHRMTDAFDHQFLLAICFGPVAWMMLFSILTGGDLKTSWSTPLFNFFGIFLMAWVAAPITRTQLKRYGIGLIVLCVYELLFYIWGIVVTPFTSQKAEYENFPGQLIATTLTKEWHQRYHTRLSYVIGTREPVLHLFQFSNDHPDPFFEGNHALSPWISLNDFNKKGGIVILYMKQGAKKLPSTLSIYSKKIQWVDNQSYPWAVNEMMVKPLHLKNLPLVTLYVGFIPPASDERKV